MKHYEYSQKMKLSNTLLLGAGAFICLLLLTGVITARVIFDRRIVPYSTFKPAPLYTTYVQIP
ncbi:MAG: hypothetical protein AB9828_08500 [Sphaerochaetaceae bacterium]|jgi:hypothetical protein